MDEFAARCRICNEAWKVQAVDLDSVTVVLASRHPDVPNAQGYVVIYDSYAAAMEAIRNSGFADENMEIPIFTRPQGWSAKFN